MRQYSAILIITLAFSLLSFQTENDWDLFSKATFKEIFVKEFFTFKSLLLPTKEMKSIEGSTITLAGYYIPVVTKDNSIIISRNPFASCFFCGNAGQETVADIRLTKPLNKTLKADERIKVKGKLVLNFEDWETLCFILEDAEVVKN